MFRDIRQAIDINEFVGATETEKSMALGEIASHFGFDHCAYACQIYPPMSRPTMLEIGNLPSGWKNAYRDKNLQAHDPLLAYAHKSHAPLLWDEEMALREPEYWQLASTHGLRHGCSIPLWTRHGCIGLASFSRSDRALSRQEFDSKVVYLAGIAHEIHAGMLAQHMCNPLHGARTALSERERTILKWTADGKTSSEVAMILGLTQRTINFHIGRAVEKLNATNKTQAALKAAVLGLLF